jgi:CheY-like chemotaxis protein
MFSKDPFLEDHKHVVAEGQKEIREVLQEAFSEPGKVMTEVANSLAAGLGAEISGT